MVGLLPAHLEGLEDIAGTGGVMGAQAMVVVPGEGEVEALQVTQAAAVAGWGYWGKVLLGEGHPAVVQEVNLVVEVARARQGGLLMGAVVGLVGPTVVGVG